ncbi:Putative methylisocitrate lyase 2 [Corynebacterium glyciniphilum AJ 3170]|uniref:Methylisocitrate lyase n=1 Tax=Corynebacterium glyciniphilum AJ 3170 TaxID=1404245 RepID=X5DWS3_9CORY|nr:methylisocitrate lyase [Corynebacterium glyciniphilum]AHW65072.1 Putative methylisocitrate lyase 2 [Corynebacterium glyciniphilum AJ 3170]
MPGLFSSNVTPTDRRTAFRKALTSGTIQRLPGAFSPLVARAIQEAGLDGVYVSGAVVAADLALPDIGLTTLTEVAGRSRQIARATDLPVLVDADTGFGEPMSAARTVSELEDAGVAGCHLEDQVNPKRCGHLDGKEVVPTELMLRRITAAVNERRDDSFVICARTDAAAVEGIDSAIERAKAYADAGADLIFTEALHTPADFEKFRAAVDTPLLANMTEFGKTELLSASTLQDIGYNAVIYPVTTLRIAMGQVEAALSDIAETGTQTGWIDRMQHRSRLYELLRYSEYNAFDTDVFTYTRPDDN